MATRTAENRHLPKYYTNEKTRQKIDRRLHKINAINATKCIDSTLKEVSEVNANICKLMGEIRVIDPEYYLELSPDV